jgi:hypothetical protein
MGGWLGGKPKLSGCSRRSPGTGLVEHAEGAVAGVDQVDGTLHDPPEHRRQVEVAADGEDGVQQLSEAPGTRDLDHPSHTNAGPGTPDQAGDAPEWRR